MDKETYWKNRKVGKRGQGEQPSTVVKVHSPQEWQELKEKERFKFGKLA